MNWRQPYDQGRLLVLSPFTARQRRPTTELAEDRNHFVATLATNVLVAYAGPGSKTAQFCGALVTQHRRAYTLDLPENAHLVQHGVLSHTLHDLLGLLQPSQGEYSAHAARD
jgi:predicted Rossmann fold nucleotide-binding protein DprA/Smf involved in DNA uptake